MYLSFRYAHFRAHRSLLDYASLDVLPKAFLWKNDSIGLGINLLFIETDDKP